MSTVSFVATVNIPEIGSSSKERSLPASGCVSAFCPGSAGNVVSTRSGDVFGDGPLTGRRHFSSSSCLRSISFSSNRNGMLWERLILIVSSQLLDRFSPKQNNNYKINAVVQSKKTARNWNESWNEVFEQKRLNPKPDLRSGFLKSRKSWFQHLFPASGLHCGNILTCRFQYIKMQF